MRRRTGTHMFEMSLVRHAAARYAGYADWSQLCRKPSSGKRHSQQACRCACLCHVVAVTKVHCHSPCMSSVLFQCKRASRCFLRPVRHSFEGQTSTAGRTSRLTLGVFYAPCSSRTLQSSICSSCSRAAACNLRATYDEVTPSCMMQSRRRAPSVRCNPLGLHTQH